MRKNKKKIDTTNQSYTITPKVYILLLSIVVIAIYAQTTYYDFVNIDDGRLIQNNRVVTDPSTSYKKAFTYNLYNAHYKPLVFASWKAEHNLFGETPGHFHLINWLLHLANTILLFFVGIKLFEKLYENKKKLYFSAFLLALLFTINPLRIESVAWATERKDVLFSLFFLGSWLLYIFYTRKKNYWLLLLGALLFLFSGLSKSMGITLIAVLFLTDFWYLRKFTLKLIIEKLPYVLVFLVLIFLYGFLNFETPSAEIANTIESAPAEIEETIEPASAEIEENFESDPPIKSSQIPSLDFMNNLPSKVQLIFTSSLRYILWIQKTFIPLNLSVIYSQNEVYGFWGKSIFLFPIIIAALYFFFWEKRKKNLALLGGLLFFGITLSPALAIKDMGQAVFLSDRYTYIPSIGLFFIAVVLINQIKFNSNFYKLILATIFVFYFSVSMKNVTHWKNSENLFLQAIKVSPKSGLGYLNLGKYYRQQNKYNEALEIYNNGILNNPGYYLLYYNRGKIFFDQDQIDMAITDYSKCLEIAPRTNYENIYSKALASRGAAYGKKQDYINAILDLSNSLEMNPRDLGVLSNRGVINFRIKEYENAIKDFSKYTKRRPNNHAIINTIGLSYFRLEKYEQALVEFNKCISLDGSKEIYYMNRSFVLNAMGNKTDALTDALKAQQMGYNVNANYLNFLKK